MANSVDPDQTAPLGAVWSGSTLFAQTYLSENLGSFWYISEWWRKSPWMTGLLYVFQARNIERAGAIGGIVIGECLILERV